ncbi:hypothetical protein K5E40_14500 [Pseudomonas baetica]|nr:hypothetical protein [Pseudomonas baetica]
MSRTNAREAQSAGEMDRSFANAGLQTLQFPTAHKTVGQGVATTPTGQIMVSATVTDASGSLCYGLARLRADGHLDTTFGQAGYVVGQYRRDVPSHGGKLSIDASGGIWVCGLIKGTSVDYEQIIARFLPDGSPDLEFGDSQSGYKIIPMRVPSLFGAVAGSLELAQSDQKAAAHDRLLFATSKQGGALLTRFFLDGSDDTAFNANGWIYITHPGVAIQLQGVTQLNSGLILVYGKTEVTHQGWIMAFENAGQVAKSFGNDGTLLLNIRNEGTPLESSVNGIVEQSAQRLLLIGAAVEAAGGEKRQHAFMTGITHAGEIDPSFNGGAPVLSASTQPQELKSWVAGFVVDDSADQRIVAVGQTSGGHRNLLTGGFLKDGAVDESFDLDGTAEIDWIAGDACLQDASVVVLGTKNDSAQLIRLLTHS